MQISPKVSFISPMKDKTHATPAQSVLHKPDEGQNPRDPDQSVLHTQRKIKIQLLSESAL
jgi:hypothetical protein